MASITARGRTRALSILDALTLKKVLVVGTFRSGTNVTQHCLETFFRTKVVFNEWFWKHGVPPTEILRPVPEEVPILVMSKDPVELNASLYRFWKLRRPELDIGENISDFVRRRFIVYDNTRDDTRPRYYYSTPTEYWNQYYFSWLNWKAAESHRAFLRCEALMADPEAALQGFAERFALERRGPGPVALPEKRVGPTVKAAAPTDEQLTEDDIAHIRALVDPQIAAALGYEGYGSTPVSAYVQRTAPK